MLIPGFDFYGGSTVMRLSDANGVPFMSCYAKRQRSDANLSDDIYAFRIFKGANLEEVPLTPVCTGGGTMNTNGWWVAANGREWFNGPIPGFAPHPVGNGDPRVDALISQLGELSQDLAHVETALANLMAEPGALGPQDRAALDKLKAFLSI